MADLTTDIPRPATPRPSMTAPQLRVVFDLLLSVEAGSVHLSEVVAELRHAIDVVAERDVYKTALEDIAACSSQPTAAARARLALVERA